MAINWTTGQLKLESNLTKWVSDDNKAQHSDPAKLPIPFLNTFFSFPDRVPYPVRLAASEDTLAVISMVCCKSWQVGRISPGKKSFRGSPDCPSSLLSPLRQSLSNSKATQGRENGGLEEIVTRKISLSRVAKFFQPTVLPSSSCFTVRWMLPEWRE